jgi:hypothetical protein
MLDLSRRLRMDEPKPGTTQRDKHERTGAHPAPVAVDDAFVAAIADQADEPAVPPGKGSHVVYCKNEQEVRKGFAMALRAMGLG